ncbi:MAG: sugar transferase, partial [Clostridia bacterium]|nr:sugar transferase [Clostridia bacterium]
MNKNRISDRASSENAPKKTISGFYSPVKRLLDFMFSLAGIIVLALPMIIITALIRIDSSGNAIFAQKRIGRFGKVFECYKFRTMKKSAPKYLATKDLDDAQQFITRTGKFLRKTSLDELPQ